MKKRILLCNDASLLSTGYGVYGKEILTRLHNSDKYEVAELGCYITAEDQRINSIPWKFYPNAVSQTDKRFQQYTSSTSNQFGMWRFNRCLLDFKPHIVFDVRDYWMYSYQEMSPLRKYYSWVLMPTVDSAPQKTEWLYTFSFADLVVPYTEWATKVLSESCGSSINMFPKVANAGINKDEFYPLEKESVKNLKKQIFGIDNPIIIGTVMRNQKRKLFADLLVAFKKYLNKLIESNKIDEYNRSFLYLHTTYPEENGWDLPSLLIEHGIANKVYFTHVCRSCKTIFANKFQGSISTCPGCSLNYGVFPAPSVGVETQHLNVIYNIMDLYIQYAICEGFGMPQIEAASCGVPIASVNYSAMPEIVEHLGGFKIPVNRIFREMETNADRAYPDTDETANIIYNYIIGYSDEEKSKKREHTRDLCISKYTWDSVYNIWDEAFESIDISKKQPWDSPIDNVNYSNNYVPHHLKKYDFVKHICDKILNESNLINTGYVQYLLKDFNNILVCGKNSVTTKEHKEVVEILDTYLKNKIVCEEARVNFKSIEKEDFILCQSKK